MTLCFGTNPIAWSNDDDRTLGAEISLETCLTEARQAGFTGIELGHKFPRDEKSLLPLLNSHDLTLVSGWYSSELLQRSPAEEIEEIQAHMNLLKAMGCEVLVFAETSNAIHGDDTRPVNDSPRLSAAEMKSFGADVAEVASYLADQGIRMAYHHHMGTVVETGEDIDRFMEATGDQPLLLLDTGHATFGGAEPARLAADYASRITHIHCKDLRKDVMAQVKGEGLSFLEGVRRGVFTVPGDGDVDFSGPLKAAAEAGYDGWLVVEAEQDPAKANPLEYATLGYKNLVNFAKGAGFQF